MEENMQQTPPPEVHRKVKPPIVDPKPQINKKKIEEPEQQKKTIEDAPAVGDEQAP